MCDITSLLHMALTYCCVQPVGFPKGLKKTQSNEQTDELINKSHKT